MPRNDVGTFDLAGNSSQRIREIIAITDAAQWDLLLVGRQVEIDFVHLL